MNFKVIGHMDSSRYFIDGKEVYEDVFTEVNKLLDEQEIAEVEILEKIKTLLKKGGRDESLYCRNC